MVNPPHPDPPPGGYWYEGTEDAVGLLAAVRRFRRADQRMRRRMESDMDVNATDVEALRHIIASTRAGIPLTARELAAHLGISTASTTKLLDRLSGSGHVERTPHPSDRRSVIVTVTEHTHREVAAELGGMHESMLEIARTVPVESRQAVIDFLDALADCVDPPDPDDGDAAG
ncbi:MarR family transcriptional regulator [Brevibacterium sanguinis]|uniref:MarR family transcriptional regulator n=2 Tax=Brevibacterium TaxID=1696 RepID=A0A366IH55_9MICO|nr:MULTISPECIES: MarR family transcriptional regulator [Brevibacterium]RBP62195.1 MarR family transcriptional regulator [Brevibacterium sanguinis]RBP70673.1 MarR family transcriptional regulator [Brevibacterium celere]